MECIRYTLRRTMPQTKPQPQRKRDRESESEREGGRVSEAQRKLRNAACLQAIANDNMGAK